jgi:hypothetical protein
MPSVSARPFSSDGKAPAPPPGLFPLSEAVSAQRLADQEANPGRRCNIFATVLKPAEIKPDWETPVGGADRALQCCHARFKHAGRQSIWPQKSSFIRATDHISPQLRPLPAMLVLVIVAGALQQSRESYAISSSMRRFRPPS